MDAPTDSLDLIPLSRAAKMVPLSRPTLRKLVHQGDVPGYSIGGRVYISRAELLRWVESKRMAPKQAS